MPDIYVYQDARINLVQDKNGYPLNASGENKTEAGQCQARGNHSKEQLSENQVLNLRDSECRYQIPHFCRKK